MAYFVAVHHVTCRDLLHGAARPDHSVYAEDLQKMIGEVIIITALLSYVTSIFTLLPASVLARLLDSLSTIQNVSH